MGLTKDRRKQHSPRIAQCWINPKRNTASSISHLFLLVPSGQIDPLAESTASSSNDDLLTLSKFLGKFGVWFGVWFCPENCPKSSEIVRNLPSDNSYFQRVALFSRDGKIEIYGLRIRRSGVRIPLGAPLDDSLIKSIRDFIRESMSF